MLEHISNDNDALRSEEWSDPDAHGQAAMLLVESLLHGMIARSIIRVEDVVEIVGVAAEVMEEVAVDRGDSPIRMQRSLAILQSIGESLHNDLPV